jgi:hypothetical protein
MSIDENFFEGPKNHNNTFRMSAESFFTFFDFLFTKKIQNNVSARFYKNHLLTGKILPVTLFRGLVSDFRKPPVTLKVFPKAACDSESCFESRPSIYTGEISTIRV